MKKFAKQSGMVEERDFGIVFDQTKARVVFDENGDIVLYVSGSVGESCPESLSEEVLDWCSRMRVSPDILLESMTDAAEREMRLNLLKTAML